MRWVTFRSDPGEPRVGVVVPPGSSELDFELEVAAVVGRGGSDLDPEEAEGHIAGFCVMNDWSARDIQRREMKLSMGPVKGKDFATSLGPALTTPDELEPYRKDKAYDLTMTASVNGREYSRASLADIHWSFGEMLAYASRGTRLVPGDVIGSGTCGTGCILELSLVHGEDAYPWLQVGDQIVLEVEHLGRLTSPDPPTGERWEWGQVWAHLSEFCPYWMGQVRLVLESPQSEDPMPFGRVKSDPARVAAIEADRGRPPAELMNLLERHAE